MWSAPWRRGPVRSCGNPPGVCGMWLVRAGRGSAVVGVDHAREDLGGPLEGLEVLGGKRREQAADAVGEDRKSTRLNSSHVAISYAVFCLKKKSSHDSHDVLQPIQPPGGI